MNLNLCTKFSEETPFPPLFCANLARLLQYRVLTKHLKVMEVHQTEALPPSLRRPARPGQRNPAGGQKALHTHVDHIAGWPSVLEIDLLHIEIAVLVSSSIDFI